MTSIEFKESDQQKISVALFVSQSLFSAAMIAMFTLMPIIGAELSGRDSAAGLPSTVLLVGRAIAAYPLGWAMDRIGRRLGLSAGFGMTVFGAGVAIYGIVVGSFLVFLAGVLVVGFGRAAADQSRYVAAEVYEPERRAKVIGLIVFAGTIGSIVGPSLVNFSTSLMTRYELPTHAGPFFMTMGLALLAFLVIFLMLRPDPQQIGKALEALTAVNKPQSAPTIPHSIGQIFARPTVQLALASMIIGQLVMVLLMTITPLHMNHNNHTTQSISFVIMAHTMGMFGLSSVTGTLVDKYGRIPMIALGSLLLIISAIMTPISATFANLAIALFLLGLGWNFTFVAGSSLLSDSLNPDERSRTQGASEMLIAISAGVGSFSTGGVYAFREGGITAVSAVGLSFSLFLVAWLVWHRVRHQPNLAQAD